MNVIIIGLRECPYCGEKAQETVFQIDNEQVEVITCPSPFCLGVELNHESDQDSPF